MWKCKTKDIQPYLDIQAYSGIIQAYSETCVTLAYSELWYIQNQRHIEKPGISKTLAYSKPEAY